MTGRWGKKSLNLSTMEKGIIKTHIFPDINLIFKTKKSTQLLMCTAVMLL